MAQAREHDTDLTPPESAPEIEPRADPPGWPEEFQATYPFPFDAFQWEAIHTLAAGQSVMVAAPTGSGKTIVAEYAVFRTQRGGGRIFYTTPIKALSNQKYADLRERYGDDVGLLTGDISENPRARVIVMTTEILRNMILQTPWELHDLTCVVFDEIHYLADPDRGTTWEESIILCPEHIQLVCLSATVSNASQIADWISRTHRPVHLITHAHRPVPLSLYYYTDQQLALVVDAAGRVVTTAFDRVGGEARRQMADRARGGRRPPLPHPAEWPEPSPTDVVNALAASSMLPAIYFLFSRRDCEAAADQALMMKLRLVGERARLQQIDEIIARHLGRLRQADLQLGQVQVITRLARRGVGYHHAGLLPPLKRLVEDLFTRGLMAVVFATDTLALGVNMPARAVVIGRMQKYDGVKRRLLLPNEFQQMAGRAGRRGLDHEGFVVAPYSPWISFRETLEVATGPLLPVMSAFTIRYNTVLNLWDPPRGSRVRTLLHKSLHEFQTAGRLRELEATVLDLQTEIDAVPSGCLLGYENGDSLLWDYERQGQALSAARSLLRQLEQAHADLLTDIEREPWTPPSREALRRAFRHMEPGTVIHHQREGWGLFLNPGGRGGPGLFLFGDRAVHVGEHRVFDYLLPTTTSVELPDTLINLPGPRDDITALLSNEEQAILIDQLRTLDLPDLAAWKAEFRVKRAAELADNLRDLEAQIAQARARVESLTREREGHVCETCTVRKQHQRYIRARERLERDRAAAEERVRRETRQEQQRIDRLVNDIASVLHAFGYLERGQLTPKADMIANIFDPNGLILAECIDRGWLDELEADDLAEFCSWFAFDRDTKFANHFLLPPRLIALRQDLESLQHEVLREERRGDLAISTGYNRVFYGAMRAWCRGHDLVSVAEQIELSEGDLVTTFNKTIDLMRQITAMLVETDPEHPLRVQFEWAIKLVRRDIVEQSYRLGFLLTPDAEPPPTGETPGQAPTPALDPALLGARTADDATLAPPTRRPRRRAVPSPAPSRQQRGPAPRDRQRSRPRDRLR